MNELANVEWFYVVLVPPLVLLGLMIFLGMARQFIQVCRPNQVLIFSGRSHTALDGTKSGYRVVKGGWTFRWPILEKAERMDMTLITVPMNISGAYSEGGIPLAVHAIANVKVSSDPKILGNAIERFLNHSREQIGRVAKETLEGHLRGVLATMTPEEVNEDRLKFAERLTEEAGTDLRKLGLQLDTLKIQQVTDERNYLESIGRKRIAEIIRTAEVAESDAIRAAEEAEATASARGGVARTKAEAQVQQRANKLRQMKAQFEALARSEEERAEQAAYQARAEAEQGLQTIRADLEQLRLVADVKIPAETERRVLELLAEGESAHIAARGQAVAKALNEITLAWKECGDEAMEMVVLQNLEQVFANVATTAGAVQAKNVTLLDSGDGATLAGYVDAYPNTVLSLLGRVSDTFGVDILELLRGGQKRQQASTRDTRDVA